MNVGKVRITVTQSQYVPILLDPLPVLARMVILVMVYLVVVRIFLRLLKLIWLSIMITIITMTKTMIYVYLKIHNAWKWGSQILFLNVNVWNDSNGEAENSGEVSLHSCSLRYGSSYQNYPNHTLNNLKSSRKYHLNVIFSKKLSKRLLFNTKRESY